VTHEEWLAGVRREEQAVLASLTGAQIKRASLNGQWIELDLRGRGTVFVARAESVLRPNPEMVDPPVAA
jgi:hypothetical protein